MLEINKNGSVTRIPVRDCNKAVRVDHIYFYADAKRLEVLENTVASTLKVYKKAVAKYEVMSHDGGDKTIIDELEENVNKKERAYKKALYERNTYSEYSSTNTGTIQMKDVTLLEKVITLGLYSSKISSVVEYSENFRIFFNECKTFIRDIKKLEDFSNVDNTTYIALRNKAATFYRSITGNDSFKLNNANFKNWLLGLNSGNKTGRDSKGYQVGKHRDLSVMNGYVSFCTELCLILGYVAVEKKQSKTSKELLF